MTKKQKNLESKLGSWADQANLSRNQSPSSEAKSPASSAPARKAAAPTTNTPTTNTTRATYPVAHSLMDRITNTADTHDMSPNEVVGHLLTWALDQVDAGTHQLPPKVSSASPAQEGNGS